MDPLLIVFGLGIGVLIGLTGTGGGSLFTPLLIIVFGVKPVTAIGTDLAYGAVTRTVGGWRHWRQRTVDLRLSTWMACGSVPSSIVGVFALKALERSVGGSFDGSILTVLAAALLLCGVATLARFVALPNVTERQSVPATRANKLSAGLVGVVVGFVVGVTSAGSGALIAVALILGFRLVPRRVVGTDVFHAAILLWAAALAHLVAGDINFALAGTILIGSIPGVWVGSQWAVRVPTDSLRFALSVLLIGSGLGLLAKAGVGVPTPVLAAVPILVAVLVGGPMVRARLRRRRGRRELAVERTG